MWFCFQSPMNSQVKFLTLPVHPKTSELQGSVGQGEVKREGELWEGFSDRGQFFLRDFLAPG